MPDGGSVHGILGSAAPQVNHRAVRRRVWGRAALPRVVRRSACVGFTAVVATMWCVSALVAQTVVVEGPSESKLQTVSPTFTVRAAGFGSARPLRVTMQIATDVQFGSSIVFDSTVVTNDSVLVIQTLRLLPASADVYWKAVVQAPGQPKVESATIGPRATSPWLTLLTPNSPAGDIIDQRRPTLVWSSPSIATAIGPWRYDVEILSQGRLEQRILGTTDTTWQVTNPLQSNTSYRWRVRAFLANGLTVTVNSAASFVVKDQPVPLTNLLYQNFPNPFPSAVSFATCIWFDVAEPGARVAMDVTDIRGNLVRTLIPGGDGQRDFLPGRYGQGVPGLGSSCDNRFVWDGTGNDGRTVAPGVYLLRFQTGRQPPTFRRMLFLGR